MNKLHGIFTIKIYKNIPDKLYVTRCVSLSTNQDDLTCNKHFSLINYLVKVILILTLQIRIKK
jgi:hypothetical protein